MKWTSRESPRNGEEPTSAMLCHASAKPVPSRSPCHLKQNQALGKPSILTNLL